MKTRRGKMEKTTEADTERTRVECEDSISELPALSLPEYCMGRVRPRHMAWQPSLKLRKRRKTNRTPGIRVENGVSVPQQNSLEAMGARAAAQCKRRWATSKVRKALLTVPTTPHHTPGPYTPGCSDWGPGIQVCRHPQLCRCSFTQRSQRCWPASMRSRRHMEEGWDEMKHDSLEERKEHLASWPSVPASAPARLLMCPFLVLQHTSRALGTIFVPSARLLAVKAPQTSLGR